MWAALTPYAREFGADWLHVLAGFTQAARIGSREHWLSDTVGGAIRGWGGTGRRSRWDRTKSRRRGSFSNGWGQSKCSVPGSRFKNGDCHHFSIPGQASTAR